MFPGRMVHILRRDLRRLKARQILIFGFFTRSLDYKSSRSKSGFPNISTMAEIAATVVGIAGVAGVLQSIVRGSKPILIARDFDSDFETREIVFKLLLNSLNTWEVSVGLTDLSGIQQD
jgi:hypothetical protein